jgi:hypothetical protein
MPHLDTPQSICRFGIARTDITPPVGIYHRMWGAAAHDRSTGVHRPLTATAVTLQRADLAPNGDDDEQIIVALDHCLLWDREMRRLLDGAARQSGVAAERILVTFSHTHAAGLMDASRRDRPGGDVIEPYLARLADEVGDLIAAARGSAQEATIVYGAGRCSLAAHRDMFDPKSNQYVCGFNPDGPADDTLLVARATDPRGNTIATIVKYACHPTTLAWQNTLISPDYVGAMREMVESATGAPCVFLQGASGDLGPREGYVADVQTADRNGRELGHAALAAIESLPPPRTRFVYTGPVVSGATLGSWAHRPLDESALRSKADWRLARFAIDLPYRPDLPRRDETLANRERWSAEEAQAREGGDLAKSRDCRAMVERADRQLARLAALPPGDRFPMPVWLAKIGDAVWLGVECEHYQHLQTALRGRFPRVPIVVMTLCNGSRAAYLPTRDAYGKGIYQESIAVLAPGSLERLTDEIAARIEHLLASGKTAAP